MNNHHFRAAVQLLGENPRCRQPTKCNFVGGNLGHIPAVTSESCGCCHSHSHGDQGPSKRDLSAWDKQSSWKSFCSLFTSKKPPPILVCLDTRGNFLCSSGLSFLGCAAHPRVSCSTNIQTCQPACQDEKEVFKQNFNCSMTPVELSHCVQGLFSDVYSALSENLTALEFSNRTNPCHFQRWHWKSFPLPVCPHYLLFNCPHTGRTGQTQGSYQDPPSINDFPPGRLCSV